MKQYLLDNTQHPVFWTEYNADGLMLISFHSICTSHFSIHILINAPMYSSLNSATSSGQPPTPGLSDRAVADIADDIETEEQVAKLGRVLGFSQAAINRYLATNRLEGKVTSKGTREMLFAWRQNTPPPDHESMLDNALQRSGLVLTAHTHLEGASLRPADGKTS